MAKEYLPHFRQKEMDADAVNSRWEAADPISGTAAATANRTLKWVIGGGGAKYLTLSLETFFKGFPSPLILS